MKISCINNSYFNKKLPQYQSFKSTQAHFIDKDLRYCSESQGFVGNYSYLLRKDIDWINLGKILDENFKDKNRVNVYSLACSDGSEAYSLAITLKEIASNPNKFFPIVAIDRDKTILSYAQQGRINLKQEEINLLHDIFKTTKEYFINPDYPVEIPRDECALVDSYRSFSPIPEIKDVVKFKEGNLVWAMDKIQDEGNSCILCRNVIPYLTFGEKEVLIKKFHENIKKGSILIMGAFDSHTDVFKAILGSKDFKVLAPYVFKRI